MVSQLKALICFFAVIGGALSAEWSYSGSTGPSHWGDLSATCNGQQQSPINIFEGDTKNENYEAWVVNGYETASGGMTLSNNGHTAVVSLPASMNATVTGGGLAGTFKAVQFHFHWGGNSAVGSEHLINSHAYPMELHIVHYNMKYTDINEAIAHADGLAVLGFMYETSASTNANYNDMISKLETVVVKGGQATLASSTLKSLLPESWNATSHFYRYPGSLTTPSCNEVVAWTVFTDTIKLSESQLEAFRDLQDSNAFHLIDNFRPVQPLYTRAVTTNFDSDLHWGYFGHMGTQHWHEYYSACGAKSQSPINIPVGEAEEDQTIPEFVYTGYDTTTGVTMKLSNNGHSVKVDIAAGTMTISGGGLPEGYTLAQFHFHWGSNDMQGSEHLINGVKYPMEIHLVHYKTSLGSLGAAATVPGGLAVLGFMFQVSETPNDEYNPIVEKLTLIRDPGAIVDLPAITLESILPSTRPNFFRYEGSLTTPGCYESVYWTVFEETIPISSAQLESFRSVISSEKTDSGDHMVLVDNYRPPMPINGRTILRNFAPASAAHWTYEGDHGASHWKDSFSTCGGTQQSPIDIVPTTVTLDESMPAFTYQNYEETKGIKWKLENNGHTVVISVDDHDFYKISGGDLPGTFKLAQFHFHWGSTNDRGSEHTIDSKKYPMELHLVHYNADKYSTIGEALGHADGLAVLGFMYEVTSQPNTAYFPLINKLSQVKDPKVKVAMETLKLADLIPSNTREYYRYQGSLTTPGCNEVVTWTVFRETIPISELQLQEFRSLLSSDKDPDTQAYTPLVNNYRPVQKVNTRIVKANFVIGDADASTSLHVVSVLVVLFCAILARVL